MNLKERGITVGDLLIVLVIGLSTTLLIKKFNNSKQTSLSFLPQEITSSRINFLKSI